MESPRQVRSTPDLEEGVPCAMEDSATADANGEDSVSLGDKPVEKQATIDRTISGIRKSFSSPSNLVLMAGTVLAVCAGVVDAVTFLQLGAFVSHVTGSVAKIGVRAEGIHLGRDTPEEFREASLIVVSFIFGALLCGLLVAKNEVHFGKSLYGVALLGNSMLLVAAAFLDHNEAALYLSATACGLQNGMCTMHFGAVVRTTHVTGLATDLGTALGRLLAIFIRRGCRRSRLNDIDEAEVEVDLRRMRVFVSLGLGFSLGVLAGAYLQRFLGVQALLVPACITGVSGLGYSVLGKQMKKRLKAIEVGRLEADVEEVEIILQRTQDYLHELRKKMLTQKSGLSVRSSVAGDLDATIELDDRLGHVIEVMHSVEESMYEIYGSSGTQRATSATASSPFPRHCEPRTQRV
eukprot:gb/GFBE01033843.1/.p1 GENE.gb/GFBE01033843.1/~~gb/GFBE01033843.1/.p1  ORF type:complete len:407 (+),score=64.93 gb/GFBE01033843.1/:1-1221(+)